MSLPEQEDRAIEAAREFLLALSSGRHPARPITAVRAEARGIVKHFPLVLESRYAAIWDAGYEAGWGDAPDTYDTRWSATPNPYREDS